MPQMDRKVEYTKLLLRVCDAHREFQADWRKYRPSHSASETYRLAHDTYYAREKAVADLFQRLAATDNAFLRGEAEAIDEVLDFLEIDIPAFRAGYVREWYYRRLKRLPLSEGQTNRIKNLGMALLTQPDYRREWTELARLLIRVADEDLIASLAKLIQSDASQFVQRRARLVLERILNQRHELKAFTKNYA